jgi:hypothetical protein
MLSAASAVSDAGLLDRFLVPVLVSALALGLSGWAFWWWRSDRAEPKVTSNDLLSEFRKMLADGTMTPAEFERVRAKLGNQIRQEHGERPIELADLPPLPSEDEDFEWNEIKIDDLDDPKGNRPQSNPSPSDPP